MREDVRRCCAALTDATSVKIQQLGQNHDKPNEALKAPRLVTAEALIGQGGAHRGPIIGDFLLRRHLQVDLAPTSICLPAKSEPSAFKSRTMSSMLSPPNSLKGATPHVVYCVTSWQVPQK